MCGESDWTNDLIDSVWSNEEDAKFRIDDLANEFVRKQWYDQGCDPEDFICKADWAKDGLSVTMSIDPYEEETYYMSTYELDTVLPDFEGP
mgnify:CR=1 FL=1